MEYRPPETAAAAADDKAFQFLVRSCTVRLHGSKLAKNATVQFIGSYYLKEDNRIEGK